MTLFENKPQLTHHAAMLMLSAAIEKAESIGQPQCIVIVDTSGELLAEIRMSGAKFLSRKSARVKALTSASIGIASNEIPEHVRAPIAAATKGNITGLPGGLPIWFEGNLLGGIGIGSGTGEQDIAVAEAAIAAIKAKPSK